MVMLTISVLDWKYSFWANFTQKYENYLYQLKFGTKYHSGMVNLMVMFTFSVLVCRHPFWGNLVQKFKFFC